MHQEEVEKMQEQGKGGKAKKCRRTNADAGEGERNEGVGGRETKEKQVMGLT